MPTDLTFFAALMVGLLGSSHCLGMCGGIASAFSFGIDVDRQRAPRSRLSFQLAYNLGRISSYMLVGFAAGTLGAQLTRLGLSPITGKLIAAGFMIALGLYLANWWRGLALLENLGAKLWRRLQPLGRFLFPLQNRWQAFLLGALWGWLPCGLVYAAVAWSLTAGNALDGAWLMLGFGLGTLPAMLLAGQFVERLRDWVRKPATRAFAGSLLIAFGLYSAASGLLGSPSGTHHHPEATAALQQPGATSIRAPASRASARASIISTSRRLTPSTPDSWKRVSVRLTVSTASPR